MNTTATAPNQIETDAAWAEYNAREAVYAADAAVDEARAKLRRVRSEASINAANAAYLDAAVAQGEALKVWTAARRTLLAATLDDEALAKRLASAKAHLYEASMGDYSYSTIARAQRDRDDLVAVQEARAAL